MQAWHDAWSDTEGLERAEALFTEAFGGEPDGVWASPGRVNLIGEHTDYNAGLSLPIALPHRTFVAVRRRGDDQAAMVTGMQGDLRWEGAVTGLAPGIEPSWVAYCGGIAYPLRQEGLPVPGFEAAIVSCVPVGAGLSSSAAVECAMGLALGDLSGVPFDTDDAARARLAALAVRAENDVACAPTGGMDQAASLRSCTGHALLLDSADGTIRQVPFALEDNGLALLVIDTRTSHSLADGQYGRRREDCRNAAQLLGVNTLREIADTTAVVDLPLLLDALPQERLRARVRHVITEIDRVREFDQAMLAGCFAEAGRLMNDSHASLRDDYEVSAAELDVVVGAAQHAGALGARMTGGGFGGSAIALVPTDRLETVAERILAAVKTAGTPRPDLYLATAGAPGGRLR